MKQARVGIRATDPSSGL